MDNPFDGLTPEEIKALEDAAVQNQADFGPDESLPLVFGMFHIGHDLDGKFCVSYVADGEGGWGTHMATFEDYEAMSRFIKMTYIRNQSKYFELMAEHVAFASAAAETKK